MFPEGANTAPSLYSCLKEVFMVKNPILRGFHPDPSLIRVGGDYYLATSTFEWAPGVRIYHSKDLASDCPSGYLLQNGPSGCKGF